MAEVVMVKTDPKSKKDEAGWRCEGCGKELRYTQPINFKLSLNLLKVFGDFHAACPPVTPLLGEETC
jgi:hypothetical protein